MVIVWNYTAYAQLDEWPGVWNWSGTAGADAAAGVICATLSIALVVSASLSLSHVVSGELSLEEC